MQKQILVNIYDQKAKNYGFVQTHPHLVSAERMLLEMIASGQGNVAKYPEDFSLYQIGTIDLESGEIVPNFPPQLICHAIDIKPQSTNNM